MMGPDETHHLIILIISSPQSQIPNPQSLIPNKFGLHPLFD